jgi:hypothetical protein
VLPYAVTQSASAQGQPYTQLIPPSPGPGWDPHDIVQGFLAASASFAGQQVAREYLTPAASKAWHPTTWQATVFTNDGPTIKATTPVGPRQDTATVMVSGGVQASLNRAGAYVVASAKTSTGTYRFDLAKNRSGQWRISKVWATTLLLTTTEFAADYQLRNLYFFDPFEQSLVPDPVYVPLNATQGDLLKGLVQDLIRPPGDWLGGATKTVFPANATVSVIPDGLVASVYLSLPAAAAARLSVKDKEKISAQLWYTLSGAGQGQQGQVQSVALYINGHGYVPPGASPGNPVQSHITQYRPADGSQKPGFYYLTKAGQLMLQDPIATGKPRQLAVIGHGYTSLAISPDGEYVAALHGGSVYTGMVGARSLKLRDVGMNVTFLSWEGNDNLWAVGSLGIVVVPGTTSKPATPSIPVSLPQSQSACGSSQDVTAIRIAPDGVRVAIVFGGQELAFGAIVPADAQAQQITVHLSPFSVCGSAGAFTALSWYGAGYVVALGEPGGTLTEYPVNGGTATPIPGPSSGVQWVTASGEKKYGGVIASVSDGSMLLLNPSGGESTVPVTGQWPAFPG